MPKETGPVQIAEGLYWLGVDDRDNLLQINAYLLIRNGMAVLFDPGPVPLFSKIQRSLLSLIPLDKVAYMVVSHQDPDIAASIPLWEKAGFKGDIVAHWRTALLLPAYGIQSRIVRINAQNQTLPDQAFLLTFVSLPYLHSPGTLGTLDRETRTLFSSDLFGSIEKNPALFADPEKYLRGMIYFHEHYMPSSNLLNSVLDNLEELDLQKICPQHGSIIESDIPRYFEVLRDTHCGILNSKAWKKEEQLRSEWKHLQKENLQLQESLVLNQDERIRDSITGLYNSEYFENYLPVFLQNNPEGAMAWLRLDAMQSFNSHYGHAEGDKAIAVFARIIQEQKPEELLIFRESGPQLILLLPYKDMQKNRHILSLLQKEIRDSEDFIQPLTCSIVMIAAEEVLSSESPRDTLRMLHRSRMNTLEKMGLDSICDSENESRVQSIKPILLLLEPDPASAKYLQDYFLYRGFEVLVCSKGKEALRKVDIHRPSVIISEVQIPQVDGFRIRKKLLESEDLRNIPFLYMCRRKTEDLMLRALNLKVPLVLEKPLLLPELKGWIDFLTGSSEYHGN